MLYLVRHGKAGSRHDFHGDDRMRPLSPAGQRQARALAPKLVAANVHTFVSSPFLRCIETLQPAAHEVGATVDIDSCLSEGRSGVDVIELMSTLPDGSALCSHGDVIPDVVAALERRGCEITTAPDWRKGTVWVISRDGDRYTTAHVWPPPDA
jgi:8-oxo-dGTP diphosphatase